MLLVLMVLISVHVSYGRLVGHMQHFAFTPLTATSQRRSLRTLLNQQRRVEQRVSQVQPVDINAPAPAQVRIPLSHFPLTREDGVDVVDPAAEELAKFDGDFDRDDWAAVFRTQRAEFAYRIHHVEGTIPRDLNGTFWKIGPALFKRGNSTIANFNDGDGYLTGISFQDGQAWLRSRYVVTPDYRQESAAEQFLFRGCFGTRRQPNTPYSHRQRLTGLIRRLRGSSEEPSQIEHLAENAFDARLKTPPNTNVALFPQKDGNAPHLLALHEAGPPFAVEMSDLSTEGKEDFEGSVRTEGQTAGIFGRWLDSRMGMGAEAVNAHPKVDTESGNVAMYTWQTQPLRGSMKVFIREWAPDGTLLSTTPHTMPDCCAAPHDWALTQSYYVLPDPAMCLHLMPFLMGKKGPAQCMEYLDRPLRFHLVPRPNGPRAGTEPILVDVGRAGLPMHMAGFDDQHGNVVIYSEAWNDDMLEMLEDAESLYGHSDHYWPDFASFPKISLYRIVVDVRSSPPRVIEHRMTPGLERLSIAHPRPHPSREALPFRHLYSMLCHSKGGRCASPPQGCVRLDVASGEADAWHAGRRAFTSQPASATTEGASQVPSDEMAGWLLTFVHDVEAGRPYVAILDPKAVHRGPVAKVWLEHHVPWGIHTTYVPNVHMKPIDD
ncbi:unnamed protein product [Vitrella brassicaformis CCMP3155]|uniref:Carotenoid oxygenase n=1 Tax=Vitrella brassicaformis (strain CCMP3155) TaxID=1169540 RepID=A0A0G4GDL2_VITBC|nr:unnamed protein product [Vitrella brassicaformis CCMP3155]|eukprot:CEM27487.1 unnamed protein product [Vitrella brassicaformis CCMP3155]